MNLSLRFLKFNTVGLLGAAVQLVALTVYLKLTGLHYLPATALAVETAVLHNFVWHEHWTWKERAGGGISALLARLLRFHLGNGVISILSNLFLMSLLVGQAGMNFLLANILSILLTAAANFAAGEWFVYRRT